METVLLIGTDRYVVDACVRRGLNVLVARKFQSLDHGSVDLPPNVTVLPVEDQRNPEHVLAALARAGHLKTPIAAVQSTNEQSLVSAAVIARVLNCRCTPPATVIAFRDKALQKRLVRDAGVPTAASTYVPDVRGLIAATSMPYAKLVLKPVAGVASALTGVANSVAELNELAVRFVERSGSTRHYVMEEFVSGDEWMVDGVVVGGEVAFMAPAEYDMPCLTSVERRVPIRTRRFDMVDDADAFTLVRPVVTAALRALGLVDGVFHMELFYDGTTVRFGECAARRGGGLIQEELARKFGVDLADAAIAVALGDTPDVDAVDCRTAVGTAFLDVPSGLLVGIPTPAELRARPGVEYARVDMPIGSVVDGGRADSNMQGAIALVVAPSVSELGQRMDHLLDWFVSSCETIPADASARELRAWQRARWPDRDYDGGLFRPATR